MAVRSMALDGPGAMRYLPIMRLEGIRGLRETGKTHITRQMLAAAGT